MNQLITKKLVLKDWSRLAPVAANYLGLTLLGLVIYSLPGGVALYTGSIILMGALIGGGSHLIMSSVVIENKEQNTPFIISLPICPFEYALAKILTNVIFFLALWVFVVVAMVLATLYFSWVSSGYLMMFLVVATQILVNYSITLFVAMWSQSEGWTTLAIVLTSMSLNPVIMTIANAPTFNQHFNSAVVVWQQEAFWIMLTHTVAASVFVVLTLWVSGKKNVFI